MALVEYATGKLSYIHYQKPSGETGKKAAWGEKGRDATKSWIKGQGWKYTHTTYTTTSGRQAKKPSPPTQAELKAQWQKQQGIEPKEEPTTPKGKTYPSGVTARYLGMDRQLDLGFGKKPDFESRLEPKITFFEIERQAGREAGLTTPVTFAEKRKVIFQKQQLEMEEWGEQKEEWAKEPGWQKDLRRGSAHWLGGFPDPGYLQAWFEKDWETTEGIIEEQQFRWWRSGRNLVTGEIDWGRSYTEILSSFPMVRYVITPMAMAVGLGYGIGLLKTAAHVLGTTAEIGAVSYGGYSIYERVAPSIRKGDWESLKPVGWELGVTLPSVIIGYGGGAKLGASHTASWMALKGYRPVTWGSTFYGRINPLARLKDIWVKSRAEYVPPEKVFDVNVLRGKKIFADSPSPYDSLKMFRQARDPVTGKYLVIHSTANKFARTGEITKGAKWTAHSGLYVTPYGKGSPYFLKAGVPYPYQTPVEFGFLPRVSRPAVLKFKLSNVFRSPRWARRSIVTWNKWFHGKKPGSHAVISGEHELGKPEIEAVIRFQTAYKSDISGSFLQRLKGYKYYTRFQGRNIPIREFDIVTGVSKGAGKPVSVGKLRSYDLGSLKTSYHAYVSPYTVSLSSLVSSFISSKTSYKPSYKPSYKTSYAPRSSIVSVSPSIPSYKPSYESSYKSSYKPSYRPSYKPPSPPPEYYPSIYTSDILAPTTPSSSFLWKKYKKPPSLKKIWRVGEGYRWRIHPVEMPFEMIGGIVNVKNPIMVDY